ncbi:hypothetical protein Goarm_022503 [Gossypium armourianum]|uniref:Uncharacterized protein n=1 Tax=Gossypium armourianum TaxID=34283 RepID=A0A7J9KHS5_9ROSI|nr:hypothetical protein [Gossypium armourianum]
MSYQTSLVGRKQRHWNLLLESCEVYNIERVGTKQRRLV